MTIPLAYDSRRTSGDNARARPRLRFSDVRPPTLPALSVRDLPYRTVGFQCPMVNSSVDSLQRLNLEGA